MLKVLGRWKKLTRGLMEEAKNKTSTTKHTVTALVPNKQAKSDHAIELWKTLMKKVVLVLAHQQGVSISTLKEAYQTILNMKPGQREQALKANYLEKWGKLNRKTAHIGMINSRKNLQQWRHFAICLMKQRNHRRLFVRYRTQKLMKTYIIFYLCSKQIKAYSKWRLFTKKIILQKIKKNVLRIVGNWYKLTNRMLKKAQRHSAILKWLVIMQKLIKRNPSVFAARFIMKLGQQRRQLSNFTLNKQILAQSMQNVKIQDANKQTTKQSSKSLSPEKKELLEQVKMLKHELAVSKKSADAMEHELDAKVARMAQDVETGKQRENKLMFFLYVLKEEKKCPVSEVFDTFIKPIETQRFTTDYGEDYKRVLKMIKKQTKFEKIYNRALKKMKLSNYNKDYKSDSCLPLNANAESWQPSNSKLSLKKINVIKIKNKDQTIKMPALNIMQLGPKNRSHSALPLNMLQGSELDRMELISSSTQEERNNKDIVFDPRQRKHLLDSLNIVTTREKWNTLNE